MIRGWAGGLAAALLLAFTAVASAAGTPVTPPDDGQLAALPGGDGSAAPREVDGYAELRAKIASYAGADAYYTLVMTPSRTRRDFRARTAGNTGALARLIDAGYLSAYSPMPRDCRLGLNARRPSCARQQGKTYFSFTRKALPFFHVEQLRQVNIPGLANARIRIGTVRSYAIKSVTASQVRGCDVDVVARKELAEVNEVGRVILDTVAFDEVLCFARQGGAYKLRRFHRLY